VSDEDKPSIVSGPSGDPRSMWLTRSDVDKEAQWAANKKKIENPGYAYVRHTSDEYVSGVRNAADGYAWGAMQLNLTDLRSAMGNTDAGFDDTEIQKELAAQAAKIEKNTQDISLLKTGKADIDHTHDGIGNDYDDSWIKPALDKKSDITHTHGSYSDINHTHDTTHTHTEYQPKGDYASDNHGHIEYETKTDATIAHDTLNQSISNKADSRHQHDGTYAEFIHSHPLEAHGHDDKYQKLGNYAEEIHFHDEYVEGTEFNALDAKLDDEIKDREEQGNSLQEQIDNLEKYDDTQIKDDLAQETADREAADDELAEALEQHNHDGSYVRADADTNIRPTPDNPFVSLKTRRFQEDDGTPTNRQYGLQIDLNEGNTYKNQFEVGTSTHGYALRVLGGSGRQVWIGGSLAQKDGNKDNPNPEHYVTRKNLDDALDSVDHSHEHDEYATKLELEEIQVEVDALVTTREAGQWSVRPDGNAPRSGEVTFATYSMSARNQIWINETDLNGTVHKFAGLEVGDYLEVVQETGDKTGVYGLHVITEDWGGEGGIRTLLTESYQSNGNLGYDSTVFIKIFHANSDLDMAELDERYALKDHVHSTYFPIGDWSDSEYEPYPDLRAMDNSYTLLYEANKKAQEITDGAQNRRLDALEENSSGSSVGRRFKYTTSSSPGEGFFFVGGDAVFNFVDLNGVVRKMTTGPEFSWDSMIKMTVWNTDGELWYAADLTGRSNWSSTKFNLYVNQVRYDRGLVSDEEYDVTIEGYW
jgi:hypothetical protein